MAVRSGNLMTYLYKKAVKGQVKFQMICFKDVKKFANPEKSRWLFTQNYKKMNKVRDNV